MAKVSILIPSRNESFEHKLGQTVLQRTVQDIYEKTTGDFEVIVGFDGPPYQEFPNYPNLHVVKFPLTVGIKTGINALAAMATGKYIYKSDAHCAFGKGFDEILQADMEDDWIVMPRFKIIHSDWNIQMRNGEEEFYDYFFLCCPFTDPRGFRFKAGGHWKERTEQLDPFNRKLTSNIVNNYINEQIRLMKPAIDETPQIHGSGWFMTKDRYFELGGFPNVDPYGHAQEPIWLAMKNWMAGGKVMVNKKTWYAHMHQQGNKRGYHMGKEQEKISYDLAATFFVGDKWDDTWPKKVMSFEQFVEKFMPMPGWPDNWKEILHTWQEEHNGI